MEGNDFEYIYETLTRRQKEIERKIKYHNERIDVLKAEYNRISKVLENMLKHK